MGKLALASLVLGAVELVGFGWVAVDSLRELTAPISERVERTARNAPLVLDREEAETYQRSFELGYQFALGALGICGASGLKLLDDLRPKLKY